MAEKSRPESPPYSPTPAEAHWYAAAEAVARAWALPRRTVEQARIAGIAIDKAVALEEKSWHNLMMCKQNQLVYYEKPGTFEWWDPQTKQLHYMRLPK